MGGRIVAIISVVVLVGVIGVGGYILVSNPASLLDARDKQLASSLARELSDQARGGCAERGRESRRYRCAVEIDQGGGASSLYRLVYDDDGCWQAQKVMSQSGRPAGGPDQSVSGCVGILDFVSPKTIDE